MDGAMNGFSLHIEPPSYLHFILSIKNIYKKAIKTFLYIKYNRIDGLVITKKPKIFTFFSGGSGPL